MHELISPDSAIEPLVTSQSGVCCTRTSVSNLVVKLHSLYRCRLVLRTPYACSPAIDDSVLIVAGRVHRCLRVSLCSSSAISGGRSSRTLVAQDLSSLIYRVCVQIPVAFLPACTESRKKS